VLSLGPRFEEIESELASLNELREKPRGTIRISATDFAADTVLWPRLSKALQNYPDITVEINLNYGLVDIVADRLDAGVRFGDQVAKDMIAVRIGPDVRMAVVGSPTYFNRSPALETPHDLTAHDCINLRLPTHDGLLAWEFVKDGKPLNVHVQGQWIFNSTPSILRAALGGFGLGYLPEEMAKEHVAAGRLKLGLQDWCPVFPGHHLYYPSRRQPSPAFVVVLEALCYSA
jgi:DNA-binding transcriptional LysR family regulator